ncbi:MAG: AbrB/MazE/SpoVT family DNA-binding domain-containing protein [Opitutaceae bacterium]|jgi:AbrB family looped-hinge helix DNA binding protein|nr:AbrB/MazE/SpoVT family DNA-binding domain-containing protein [Opitutaceae bacterium]
MTKGQVTIPRKLRDQYGMGPRTEVVFEAVEGGVLIRPAASERIRRLRTALRRSRGSATAGLNTAAIMQQTRGDN